MINLFSTIEEVYLYLQKLKNENQITDYRIILSAVNDIIVYIKSNAKRTIDLSDFSNVYVSYVENDEDDALWFSDSEKLDISSSRIRLDNLLNNNLNVKQIHTPVISFYSYKGGVGRSTTVASYAANLSIKNGKKVVILDCDFEAPGFTNFFLENPTEQNYHNGLIEFFFDIENNQEIPLEKYYWETSKTFSGDGSIYVFQAGNLDSIDVIGSIFKTNCDHYLNALARFDLMNKELMCEKFTQLFKMIEEKIKPDVILIDSRTGFNDFFSSVVLNVSDIIVGFFGGDAQSVAGWRFFLDLLQKKNLPRLIIANSIIPQYAKTSLFNKFKEQVINYLEDLQFEESDDSKMSQHMIDIFPIGYNEVLRNIGMPIESYEEFINLINNNESIDYKNLFEKISEYVDDIKYHECCLENSVIEEVLVQDTSTMTDAYKLKHNILSALKENMPCLYAENIVDFNEEYLQNRYYYRRCMEDLFNPEKILVIGNKGTGKTYIYKSLGNKPIVAELQARANKKQYHYEFIKIVNEEHPFSTSLLGSVLDKYDTDFFYERFWLVFIWNAIMTECPCEYKTDLNLINLHNEQEAAIRFKQIINDDELIIKIEKDLYALDKFLASNGNNKVVFIFDGLDKVVKPILWSEQISPLINLCRRMNYICMSPKLFLRSDLYEKIGNINNKNELSNKTINIEWSREELFSYFFKFVLINAANDFNAIMKEYKDVPNQYVNKMFKNLSELKNQPPLDEYLLRQMCGIFFGKYTEKYGESYDWFFRNLKNANGTISLRPFIDLLSLSIEYALENDNYDKPILHPLYYTHGSTRASAVQNHFNDLAAEEGNNDLKLIFNYIQTKAPQKYKKIQLGQSDFMALLDLIINNSGPIEHKDRDSLIELLTVNGIIRWKSVRISSKAYTNYQFALLYKYYLGLKNVDKKFKK